MDATAVVGRFVAAINANDVDALAALMTDDHELILFDEAPVAGRSANVEAWRGYCTSFPAYVIHPHRTAETADGAAVLGHTTGSHLGLPDEEEAKETLIWLAEVVDGHVRRWQLIEDTVQHREQAGLGSTP